MHELTGPLVLGQSVDFTEAPTSVAAALALVVTGFITGLIRRGSECVDHAERAKALQTALDLERERAGKLTDALEEQKDLGRLMRQVLYALPQDSDTPPPPPLGRRTR